MLAYLLEANTNDKKPQDNLWLSIILALTCIITGVFSFYQERKSSRITESFAKMIPTRASVLRDGSVKEIDAASLVRGDIVLLKIGDKVPADIRLIEIHDMKVENSSLTGEVEPVSCTLAATNSFAVESKNLVFFSTNLVSGFGKGVVILTGSNTVMGKIAGLTNKLEKKITPIEQEVQNFMHLISIWALTLGFVCFLLAVYIGYNWLNACVYVIGIIVANVPEGLLATLTVSLTLTAKRLASKNCIVKRLQTVETLGSIKTICTDKTGTLTQNKMTVLHLCFNRKIYNVENGVDVEIDNIESNTTYKTMIRAACLCSKAEFESSQDTIEPFDKKASGDATEVGILNFIHPRVKNVQDVRNSFPKVAEIPFNSLNKYHLTVHFSPLNKYFLLIKGAPEVVLERCTSMMVGSESEVFLTAENKYELEYTIELFASKGERVLAFADLHLPPSNFPVNFQFTTDPMNFPSNGFRFIGLMSLYDPPRPEVSDAIDDCHKAGIRVIMVTGDHPFTAKTIAKKCHILSENSSDDQVYTGTDLRKLSDGELKNILKTNEQLVFARTSPMQKLRIVEQCQSLDEIVAVTGDGVNDSPALKKADIGIAMGITGSEVSKQTADMILMDDNFATIVQGIEEGRLIFDNLKKSIAYILASNIPEILPFLFYIFVGIPLPVSTVTVLCIDLGTDMWPAVSLAYEEPESDIMTREPRNPKTEPLVGRKLVTYAYFHLGILETLAGFLTYFHVMYDSGWYPGDLINIRKVWESKETLEDSYGKIWSRSDRVNLENTCQTAYFIAIVLAQCATLIVCKTRYNSIYQQKMNNWVLNVGLVFELMVAFLVTYAPYLNKVLKTRPVSAKYWFTPLPIAMLIIVYGELGKIYKRLAMRSRK
uniref:Sodium/potassium-transporting ATPase subunit alpha n=1 Tax=Cacopsylla melanoneura TaxID=428564 RepID=A0A8D9EII8_9HEMI